MLVAGAVRRRLRVHATCRRRAARARARHAEGACAPTWKHQTHTLYFWFQIERDKNEKVFIPEVTFLAALMLVASRTTSALHLQMSFVTT